MKPVELLNSLGFVIGLRKFTGEYSFPKDEGVLIGIIFDVLIAISVLMHIEYLKSTGLWGSIKIDSQYLSAPSFTASKENSFSLINFVNRLFPELAGIGSRVYKPGKNYFEYSFVILLLIFVYTLLFNNKINNKRAGSIQDALDNQQFSKDLVYSILAITLVMVLERVLFKYSSLEINTIYNTLSIRSPDFQREIDHVNITMALKYLLHLTIIVLFHFYLFIRVLPYNEERLYQNSYASFYYLLWTAYFFTSSIQIRDGFPLLSKGQIFPQSTSLLNRIYFKS